MSEIKREFIGWPKIARWEGETMTITEKIDGTNACIVITENDIYCQSRNRILGKGSDNAGFHEWVTENQATLIADLGVGRHFGEWWGRGIQRNYGQTERKFSLFNVARWESFAPDLFWKTPNLLLVPTLYEGPFSAETIDIVSKALYAKGSHAAPGFDKPEGVVVFLNKSHTAYKITDGVQGNKQRLSGE